MCSYLSILGIIRQNNDNDSLMNLIETLLNTTHFDTAEPLWQDGMARAVFEPFFACMLANLTSSKEGVWYETYAKHSANLVRICIEMGTYSDQLDTYWRVAHLTVKEKLVQNTGVDDGVLHKVLPISAFLAYQKLKLLADNENQSVQTFAQAHVKDALPYLPAWADEVVNDIILAQLSVDELMTNALTNTNTKPVVDNQPPHALANPINQNLDTTPNDRQDDNDQLDDDDELDDDDTAWQGIRDDTPQSRTSPALLGGAVALLLALGGGGYYWYQKQNTPAPAPVVAPAPAPALVAQNRPASTIAITVGEQGELYACHARLGNSTQSDALLGILGESFSNTLCMMDISEQVSQTTTGLDKLKSVLALLKTVPFASIEMTGDKVFINAPNPADADTLVADIGSLLTGISVAKMPPLNADELISQSLSKTSELLNNFNDGGSPYELAQAMSVQKIDTQSGTIPEINKAVLALSAGKIASNPNFRFIIVVHSDDIGDKTTARIQTQTLAEAIKAELIAQGAGPSQLMAQGVGFDFPISDNQTELGRFKNRRVEFLVYDDVILQALNPPPPLPSANGTPPTFTVVDGQIVEQGDVIPPEMAADSHVIPPVQATPVIAPAEVPPPTGEIVITKDSSTLDLPIDISKIDVPEANTPLPAPSKSPIPDDLIKTIGSDEAGGVQSSQIIGTE